MPPDLPVIKVRTSEDNVIKIKTIAKYNDRSVSKEIENLMINHINEFESTVSKIEIGTMSIDELVQDIKDRITKRPPYGDNKAH